MSCILLKAREIDPQDISLVVNRSTPDRYSQAHHATPASKPHCQRVKEAQDAIMFPDSLKYILQIVIYSKDQLVKIFLPDRVSWYEKGYLNAMQEINAAHMLERVSFVPNAFDGWTEPDLCMPP